MSYRIIVSLDAYHGKPSATDANLTTYEFHSMLCSAVSESFVVADNKTIPSVDKLFVYGKKIGSASWQIVRCELDEQGLNKRRFVFNFKLVCNGFTVPGSEKSMFLRKHHFFKRICYFSRTRLNRKIFVAHPEHLKIPVSVYFTEGRRLRTSVLGNVSELAFAFGTKDITDFVLAKMM
jgi:hypothetical protein